MSAWYRLQNAHEIPSPALLVYPDRIAANLRAMVDWTRDPSRLRPHVKTHKMPQVIALKLEAGITKFKASTIAELEMTAQAGGRDILLAYQPVGPQVERLARLANQYPQVKFSTVVDDPATLDALSAAMAVTQATLHIFLDLDVGMHRTGIEPNQRALALYQSIERYDGVRWGGLHAYDGHLTPIELRRALRVGR